MQRLLFVVFLGSALFTSAQNNMPEQNNKGNYNTNGTLNTTNSNSNTNLIIVNGNSVENALEPKEIQAIPDTFKLDMPKSIESIQLDKKKAPSQRREKAGFDINENRKMEIEMKEEAAPAPARALENVKPDSFDELEEMQIAPSAAATMSMKKQFELNQNNATHQYSRRSASAFEQMNMDNSVNYYKRVIPDAFETHFYTYLAGHYNTDLFPELQAAAEMKPNDPEVIKQLAAYHIINDEPEQAVPLIRQLIDTGVVSPGQLLYANDLLISGDSASILVLHGFEDMFATYYVQNTAAVRPDVRLLSLDFMQSATYQMNWTNNSDLALPESAVIDTLYLANFCSMNASQNIQLSMTLPRDYFNAMKTNLYPVGLTFQYSEEPVNNYEENYRLWKDMNMQLIYHTTNERGDDWCINYLPMLVTLRRQLVLLGKKKEVERLDQQILAIGARTNTTDKVKKYTK